MMKIRGVLIAFLLICTIGVSQAAYLLIPMDDTQKNHLKAYGIAYWVLQNNVEVQWLLNYRGGSFMIKNNNLIQAKGRFFSIEALLGGDSRMATLFQEGCFATVYLSPRDYHRVHMPLAGRLQKMIFIPGKLFSVNQATADNVHNLFARNERVVCLFQTDAGPMALILIGAMIVASIETVWSGQVCPSAGSRPMRTTDYNQHSPPIELSAGSEMGRFKLGSTVIVLFAHGAITLETELNANTSVRMGQLLGRINGHC